MKGSTPGPWKVDNHELADFYVINPESGNWLFVIQHNGEKHGVEQNANANLIAAAPDLLEACKMARGAMCNGGPIQSPDINEYGEAIVAWEKILNAIEIAITKVRGES